MLSISPIFNYIRVWGNPMNGHPRGSKTVNYEHIASRFNLNVSFGYLVLSNGPNWESFCIISIFGVIFGQNSGF